MAPNPALAVRLIVEGFHRHDRCPAPALDPTEPPVRGAYVKLQINLAIALECAAYPGEGMNWLAMGGKVVDVLGPDRVVAELAASTDRAPEDFSGTWRAVLARERGFEMPWMLASLEPSPPLEPALGAYDAVEDKYCFKLACAGEGARAAFEDIGRTMGATVTPRLAFLPLSSGRLLTWVNAVPTELSGAESAEELLLAAADTVVLFEASPACTRRVQALLEARPQVPVMEHTPGGPPLDACTRAMKILLAKLRGTK